MLGGGVEQKPQRQWHTKEQEGNHQEQPVANPGSDVHTTSQAVMQVLHSTLAAGVGISPRAQLPADAGIGCWYEGKQVAHRPGKT